MWWEEDVGLLDRRLPREAGETISKTLKTGSAVGDAGRPFKADFPECRACTELALGAC